MGAGAERRGIELKAVTYVWTTGPSWIGRTDIRPAQPISCISGHCPIHLDLNDADRGSHCRRVIDGPTGYGDDAGNRARRARGIDENAGWQRCAGWESKRSDPRAPIESTVGLQVLVGIPESTIIHRVDSEAGVIAPPGQALQLRAAAFQDAVLGFEGVQRVAWHAAGVADGWVHGATGNAIAERDISGAVHGNAAHPAEGRVGRIR